jgi:hypothetical protein
MTRPRAFRFLTDLARTASAALALLLLASSAALAGDQPRLGIFGDVRVDKGEVYPDDLVCIGGTATVEGKVEGDVVVVGGKLEFSGEARDVVAVASRARIASGSVIDGDLIHVMGDLRKDPDVKVQGQSVDVGSHLPLNVRRLLSHGFLGLIVLFRLISLVFSLVLLLIIVLLAPERIERMSDSLEPRWPASLGFGVLAFVVSTVLVIFLAITVIGIPLALLLGLATYILELMGIAAILSLLGKRVGLGTGLIGPDPTVLSCVLVGFCVVALVRFVPVVGELAWLALSVTGLGLTLVTKLGSPPRVVGTAP